MRRLPSMSVLAATARLLPALMQGELLWSLKLPAAESTKSGSLVIMFHPPKLAVVQQESGPLHQSPFVGLAFGPLVAVLKYRIVFLVAASQPATMTKSQAPPPVPAELLTTVQLISHE